MACSRWFLSLLRLFVLYYSSCIATSVSASSSAMSHCGVFLKSKRLIITELLQGYQSTDYNDRLPKTLPQESFYDDDLKQRENASMTLFPMSRLSSSGLLWADDDHDDVNIC